MSVTATISTKNRYFTTLPLAIKSITDQTVLPEKFIMFDDGEHRDLRGVSPYTSLFRLLEEKKIQWEVVFGAGKGQVLNHQKALEMAQTEFIWRLDDDNFAEPNCLENLLKEANKDPKVGAVGGLVLIPNDVHPRPSFTNNRIEEILLPFNIQWFRWGGNVEEVDHLYSTFLYRVSAGKQAGGYPRDLSVVCHREETTFTYSIRRAGYKVLVTPYALTWHLRDEQGGIRSYNDPNLWQHDEDLFHKRLKEWGITPRQDYLFAVLDNGLGDHIVFREVLKKIREKNKDKRVVLFTSFPEVFKEDNDVILGSIADAQTYFGNIEKWSIYAWMDQRRWTKSLQEAFEGMYL